MFITLVGVLTVAHLLGRGGNFPTVVEMLRGSGGGDTSSLGTVEGPARVIDGDTLAIGNRRIRLYGIDAPESSQLCRDAQGNAYACGQEATAALSNRVGSQTVACDKRDVDRYGQIVAVCRLGSEDLNAWMVSRGWAMAYPHFSRDYVTQENQARAARRGIWQGTFTPPWDWRAEHRAHADRALSPSLPAP